MAKRLRHPSGRRAAGILGFVALTMAGAAGIATVDASAAVPGTSAWPSALHDATHSATASVVGPQQGRVLWSRSLGANITPGPVLAADGTIYIATNSGVLHALNPTSGADVWIFNGGGPYRGETDLSTSPLVLPSGSILWSGPQDTLYELSATGSMLWSHRFGGSVLSPAISGSTVYVELMTGALSAIDVSGSTPVVTWTVKVGHTSFGSPVVSPNGDVITTADKDIIAVADNGTKGVVRWHYAATASIEVSPSVAPNGDVFVTANDGSVSAVKSNGSLLWRKRIGQESYSSSSVGTGRLLYFGDNGGVLNVVRASTGVELHKDRGHKGLWGAQVIDAKGNVYFGSQAGDVYGFNGRGHQLFHLKTSGPIDSYPALSAGGILLIGDQAGTFYAIS